jgi:hypothetical protein
VNEGRLEYLRFMAEETERFGSCVLDERHLIAAAHYVELNPVRAMLVKLPGISVVKCSVSYRDAGSGSAGKRQDFESRW